MSNFLDKNREIVAKTIAAGEVRLASYVLDDAWTHHAFQNCPEERPLIRFKLTADPKEPKTQEKN